MTEEERIKRIENNIQELSYTAADLDHRTHELRQDFEKFREVCNAYMPRFERTALIVEEFVIALFAIAGVLAAVAVISAVKAILR